jgi:hypothetical protein
LSIVALDSSIGYLALSKREMIETETEKPAKPNENYMQNIEEAQLNMRKAYLTGYSGVVVSGVAWLLAGVTFFYASPKQAVWALLIGGVFIHPISIVLNKVLGASGSHAPSNPLGKLALEGTIFMLLCLPLAYGLSFQKTEWFFQAMLLIIGGRYLTFASLYGTKLYWLLGAALGMAAYFLFAAKATPFVSVLVGSAIELTFGICMLIISRKSLN